MNLNFSLIALIGLPGAGKTTLIKNLFQCITSVSFSVVHICYDDNWNRNTEVLIPLKEQRDIILKSLEMLIKKIQSSNLLLDNTILSSDSILKNYGLHCNVKLQKNSNNEHCILIICDDNHYYRSMRYKLLKLARKYQLNYGQIYVECLLEVALKRNSERNQESKVSEDIIRNMDKNLEIPNLDAKNYWENNTHVVNNSYTPLKSTTESIIKYMEVIVRQTPLECVESNLQTKISGQEQKQQSESHKLDLLMRKHIRNLIQNNTQGSISQEYVKLLNQRRRFLLKQFQTNSTAAPYLTLEEFIEKELNLPLE